MSKQAYVKAYPQEFRDKVVRLLQVGDRSPRQVGEELEISEDAARRLRVLTHAALLVVDRCEAPVYVESGCEVRIDAGLRCSVTPHTPVLRRVRVIRAMSGRLRLIAKPLTLGRHVRSCGSWRRRRALSQGSPWRSGSWFQCLRARASG